MIFKLCLSFAFAGLSAGMALAAPPAASAQSLNQTQQEAAAAQACARITAAFPSKTFASGSSGFTNQSQAIWSNTCLLTPSCVFLPVAASEVGRAVSIIQQTGSRFSVRAGGHMPVPGAQSVDPGVFISLSGFNQRQVNRNDGTVSVGPGQTWIEVYNYLAPFGLAVNGGRYPTVGVGGLFLGGGIGYFSSTQGWGCDTVVAYEAVLPNGQVVEVTAEGKYSDLFWALHGGGSSFAIITRFDVKTFPVTSAYAKIISWDASQQNTSDAFFDALGSYVAPGGGVDDPTVAIVPTVAIAPSFNVHQVITDRFAVGNDSNPAAFANFTQIQGTVTNEVGGQVYPSWTQMPQFLANTGDRGMRQIFWSVSFKADPRAISIANRTVVDGALDKLSTAANAVVALTFQPISGDWLRQSAQRGPNVLDLDPNTGTFIAGLIAVQWTDEADDALISKYCEDATAQIKKQTEALGLGNNFIYLNDAGATQKPFSTYGEGKSLPRLQAIQKKYDPKKFFQNFLTRGFNIQE